MTLSADDVERGYNNRAAVPEHPRWLAEGAARSQAAYAALAPQRDHRFGPGPKETLDLFLPAGPARGTLVFLHGGYWRALDKLDHGYVAPPFVAAGFAVANVNYDLCPAVTIATIVEQARRAVLWLVREGTKHGASVERIVVAGHSAGGQLVGMLYATDWSALGLAASPLTGGLSLSGVHDVEPLVLSTMNADFGLDVESARRVSPLAYAPTTAAPLLIAVGADETAEFIRQSQRLWDAWPAVRPRGAAGPLVLPGHHHFSIVQALADAGSPLARATLALFDTP